MANAKRGRMISGIIVLIGAILLFAAIAVPWYTVKFSEGSASESINFYPGTPSQGGTIQYSCSSIPTCPSSTSYTGASPPLNNTGMIAETGFFLLIAGGVLGLIGALLAVASRGNSRRARPAMALAVIALIIAIAAPSLYAVALPGAISKDMPKETGSGPWSTFIGSNSTTGGASLNWGPAVGWYLAFGAFVVILIGLILLMRYRKDPAEPVPVAAPAAVPSAAPPTQ